MFKATYKAPAPDPRLQAESIPPAVAYYAALRVLNHAAATKCRDLPMSKIPALEALEIWNESRVAEPPTPAAGRPEWDRDNVAEIPDPPAGSLIPRPPGMP